MANDMQKIAWPGWETVRLIGRGSFGTVYEIQRQVFDYTEKAALKVISIPQNQSDIDDMLSDGYDDESITSEFKSHLKSIVAEYSLMRELGDNANVVNCDDVRYVQHDDGIGWDIFIKMELLTPLIKALPAEIPEREVVNLARDIGSALKMCEDHNIIHRDIKPQNIFVSANGTYKLGDFGIAKTVEKTMGGTKIGTYKYMAPEVYNNQPYGTAADIYSLGLVLYLMLNERRLPFLPLPPEKLKAGMEDTARNRRMSGERIPQPAHGSEKLKRIVLKACAYNPNARYQTAAELLADLNALLGSDEKKNNKFVQKNTEEEPEITFPVEVEYADPVPAEKPKAGGLLQNRKLLAVILGVFALVVIVVMIILFRSCGAGTDHPPANSNENNVVINSEQPVQSVEEVSSEETPGEAETSSTLEKMYVVSSGIGVYIYSTPEVADWNVLARIPVFKEVEVVEQTTDEFYKVIYNGTEGYIDTDYLVDSLESFLEEDYTVAGTKYIVKAEIGAYFYSKPERNEENILCTILLDTPVDFIRESENGFSLVEYNGQAGYVRSVFLADSPQNYTVVSTKYIVDADIGAYFRSSPEDNDEKIICTILLGEPVGYIEETDNIYSRVEYKGQYGYVKTKFLADAPAN